MNGLGSQLLSAAEKHFEAKKAKALANLKIYLANPVGVSEHPDLTQEIIRLTEEIAQAEECISVLTKIK